jgi:hypothetical protein
MAKKQTKKLATISKLSKTPTVAPMMLVRNEVVNEVTTVVARDIAKVDIAARAYQRFVARGGQHGHALEDWLTAEAELRA